MGTFFSALFVEITLSYAQLSDTEDRNMKVAHPWHKLINNKWL